MTLIIPTKISSISFVNEYKEDGSAGKYVVEFSKEEVKGKEDSEKFVPYSWIDYIVPFKIENAKQRLIAAAEKVIVIKPERRYTEGLAYQQGFIENIPISGGQIVTDISTENPNQKFQYNTSIYKNSLGIKLEVRLGRDDLAAVQESFPLYTVNLKKIIGMKKRIIKNILPEINLGFDKNELDTDEKILIMNELEDDISQILSTPAQEITRKPAR